MTLVLLMSPQMTFSINMYCLLLLQIGVLFIVEVSPAAHFGNRYEKANSRSTWSLPPNRVTTEEGKQLQVISSLAGVVVWFVYGKQESVIVSECWCNKCENYQKEKYVAMSASPPHFPFSQYELQVLSVEMNLTKIENIQLSLLRAGFVSESWFVSVYSNMIVFLANNQSHDLTLIPGSDVHFECLAQQQTGPKLILYRNSVTNVLQVSDSSKTIKFSMTNLRCGLQFVTGCLIEGDKEHEKIIRVSVSPCQSNYLDFTANNERKDLVVEIGSDVVLTCTSVGEPGSLLTIYKDNKDNVLKTATIPEQLTYVMSNMSCGIAMRIFCMIDNSRTESSMRITVKPCHDGNVYFTADSKLITQTEVSSDSSVLFECTSDLGRYLKFILYNNSAGNVIHQTKGRMLYTLNNFTPGTSFAIGCLVESEKITDYSEIFITVKPDVASSNVGIIIAATVAPCLFIFGLTVYCVSKYRQKKFQKISKQDNTRFTYPTHIIDKMFQPPIFGDKSSHLKLILNLDKNPDTQPPPSYSEIIKQL